MARPPSRTIWNAPLISRRPAELQPRAAQRRSLTAKPRSRSRFGAPVACPNLAVHRRASRAAAGIQRRHRGRKTVVCQFKGRLLTISMLADRIYNFLHRIARHCLDSRLPIVIQTLHDHQIVLSGHGEIGIGGWWGGEGGGVRSVGWGGVRGRALEKGGVRRERWEP